MYIICFILRHFYLVLFALRCFFDVRDFLERFLPPTGFPWFPGGVGGVGGVGGDCGFDESNKPLNVKLPNILLLLFSGVGVEGSVPGGTLDGATLFNLDSSIFPGVEFQNHPPPFLTVRLLDLDFDACTFLLFGDICVNIYMMA